MEQFQKTYTADYDLTAVQANVSKVLDALTSKEIVNGNILEVTLASGDNSVAHKLGRKLNGWIVIGKTAAVDLYDKQATNQIKDKTLILNSSGAATIRLWVF